jgi:hypothetical protein
MPLASGAASAYDEPMRAKIVPGLVLALILSAQAPAWADDKSYCAELTNLYRRYMGNSAEGKMFPDLTAAKAMDDCEKGNTAAGIPVLEKKLRDGRFTLPKRT